MQNSLHDFIELLFSDEPTSTDIVPASHVKIYQNNVIYHLQSALTDVYPLIKKIVGETFFLTLTKKYIARYPSRQSYLQPYGEYFHEFLTEYEPCAHLVYLSEVARFEWACHQLFYVAKETAFDVNKWQQFPSSKYEQIVLTLNPACSLHAFAYPILQIIALCNGERKEEVNLDQGGCYVLLHRPDLDIMIHPLTENEWLFLTAIKEGYSLKMALDKALEKEATFELAEKLPLWAKANLIVDAYVPPTITGEFL